MEAMTSLYLEYSHTMRIFTKSNTFLSNCEKSDKFY